MEESKKKIKAKMNKILRMSFNDDIDHMMNIYSKFVGYGLNHPKYLKDENDAESAWVDMHDILKIRDYISLAHDLTAPKNPIS